MSDVRLMLGDCLRRIWGRRSVPARVGSGPPDPMRLIGYRQVGHCIYEITTESARYGRVTQEVLILPDREITPEDTD